MTLIVVAYWARTDALFAQNEDWYTLAFLEFVLSIGVATAVAVVTRSRLTKSARLLEF
jgi:hypothetical protein